MKLKQALAAARAALADGGVEDFSLEAEILLRHTLGLSRARLYADLDRELEAADEAVFARLVERRRRGEPTAYITGHREFYGRDFYLDFRTLIPRPETELLVEKAVSLARGCPAVTIADIGTGCGAIAVTLALELPEAIVYAADISAPALRVARINCRRHGVADRVRLLEGDMLEPLPEPVDLLVANLPYVRDGSLPADGPLSYEPALALYGGPDGLGPLSRLCRRAGEKLRPGGVLLLEVGQGQAETVAALLRDAFPAASPEIAADFGGIPRVVALRLTHG